MTPVNTPCPLLPAVDHVWQASEILQFGKERGADFYEASLHYAQSLWQQGLPAQAILQLNRALACHLSLSEPVMQRLPLPYKAMAWIIHQRPEGQFIGNPRRHFQHLATRMVQPHKELRTWRAWACWYLSTLVLPKESYPADEKQILEEGIQEPSCELIQNKLAELTPCDDLQQWQQAICYCQQSYSPA
jgi:hypothetical protein